MEVFWSGFYGTAVVIGAGIMWFAIASVATGLCCAVVALGGVGARKIWRGIEWVQAELKWLKIPPP